VGFAGPTPQGPIPQGSTPQGSAAALFYAPGLQGCSAMAASAATSPITDYHIPTAKVVGFLPQAQQS